MTECAAVAAKSSDSQINVRAPGLVIYCETHALISYTTNGNRWLGISHNP
jgi:hypothetical protein